jgi:uncharacterized membrane-anchored protein
MFKRTMLMAGMLLWAAAGAADAQDENSAAAEAFEKSLGYQTGKIELQGGMATIDVPADFRFIGPKSSRTLLTAAWGNPEEASADVLGMLIPANVSPLAKEGWGVVITFDDNGYVNDKDAGSMDYDKLMKEMKASDADDNAEREKQGLSRVDLVGWAEAPHYDAPAHKLYWALDLSSPGEPVHTLNYNIRILGRRGVLVLNAVSRMDQLATIKQQSQALLPAVEFKEGHRYSDYLPGTDKAAAYGIGGLILGGVAAKAGLFKLILAGLLAAKKIVIVAFVAIVGFFKKLFGGKSKAGGIR